MEKKKAVVPHCTGNCLKPSQIIVFRDGACELHFSQVLDKELYQMIQAYQHLGVVDIPMFTIIMGQKNHHTNLFQANGPDNVLPGHLSFCTLPRLDEICFSPDDLQSLIHPPSPNPSGIIMCFSGTNLYTHFAAHQVGLFLKFEDMSENTSGKGSLTSVECSCA